MRDIPIKVVGSSSFGRYPKINAEKTVNMFISDDWLVNYAGYKKIIDVGEGPGRALFHSVRSDILVYVVGDSVYKIDGGFGFKFIGNLGSSEGEVFMDENLSSQILIVDGTAAYVYNTDDDSLTLQSSSDPEYFKDISASYVTYINSFFIVTGKRSDPNSQQWYVFKFESSTTVVKVGKTTNFVGGQFLLQTKPDSAIAAKRLPGRGNNIIVFGTSVAEVWNQVGGEQNFRRNASFNIDYGIVNRSTIAANDNFICWIAKNENSAPVLMVSDGSSVKQISTDGISYLLQNIKFPRDSTAFMYKQDGHVFYQFTFYNEADNLSLLYDFKTDMFFHVTDDRSNYHPARQVAFFRNNTYFASLNEGALFEFDTDILDAIYTVGDTEGFELPRIRITDTVRNPKNEVFSIDVFEFLMEQGVNQYSKITDTCFGNLITESGTDNIVTEAGIQMLDEQGTCTDNFKRPRVDMSFSKNGGETFSNEIGRYINYEGEYRTRITWHRLGFCNEFTVQLKFWGLQRWVCNNGYIEART